MLGSTSLKFGRFPLQWNTIFLTQPKYINVFVPTKGITANEEYCIPLYTITQPETCGTQYGGGILLVVYSCVHLLVLWILFAKFVTHITVKQTIRNNQILSVSLTIPIQATLSCRQHQRMGNGWTPKDVRWEPLAPHRYNSVTIALQQSYISFTIQQRIVGVQQRYNSKTK